MSIELDIFNALKGLVSNRVYPDVAKINTEIPYITFQQVGGSAVNFLESAPVGKRNARFQINVWADTRNVTANLCRSIEDALVSDTTLNAFVIGAMISVYEPAIPIYGAHQDFSVWY